MNARLQWFTCGLFLAAAGEFLIWFSTVLAAIDCYLWKDYFADMARAARDHNLIALCLLSAIAAFLAGCGLMIWSVVFARSVPDFRAKPLQIDLARNNLEPWKIPAPAESDAVSRPNSSDIQ